MIKFHIPMPLQIVIDDVGWWSGRDGHEQNEPYRTGIARNHVPADYAAIVQLGKCLNMRPQAAMVLCEWDRENILRDVPSATWMGPAWDNSRWVGPWLDEAAEIIRRGHDHFEIVLHGVGHEYWGGPGPEFTRAEWHDTQGRMRPRHEVVRRLECFAKILEQNRLGPFPESFVPAAFRHAFGAGENGIAPLLKSAGVKYISTPFSSMRTHRPPEHPGFGVDEGLMTVDRGAYGIPWNDIDSLPRRPVPGPILGLHWPNILHPDPERNLETVERWCIFLKQYDVRPDRMLSRDTASCFTQLAYHLLTEAHCRGGETVLDFRRVRSAEIVGLRDTFTIKVQTPHLGGFTGVDLDIVSVEWRPESGFSVLQIRPAPTADRGILRWSEQGVDAGSAQ